MGVLSCTSVPYRFLLLEATFGCKCIGEFDAGTLRLGDSGAGVAFAISMFDGLGYLYFQEFV